MKLFYSLIFLCFGVVVLKGQTKVDSVQTLETVVLSDVKLQQNNYGFKTITLKDSVLQNDSKSFTDLLRFNSHIYFKENGYGMVSSPSFRGTNASQTAVIAEQKEPFSIEKVLEMPDLREDDKEIIKFIHENGGSALESDLRKKFLLPRTTMWRAVKRLERHELIEITKKDQQNLIKLRNVETDKNE